MRGLQSVVLPVTVTILVACGGGGSSDTDTDTGTDTGKDTTTYSGTLVVPQTVATNSMRIMSNNLFNTFSDACPNVPDGYEPVENVTVSLELSNGSVLDTTTTTDTCGLFNLEVDSPQETALSDSVITADIPGYKPLRANANNFMKGDTDAKPVVASTIPSDANYVISAVQKLGSNQLSFSIIDSKTNNAVIQLPKNSFTIAVNNVSTEVTDLNSADQLAIPSSNVLTIDASGSMTRPVFDKNSKPVVDTNSNPYSRLRLTAKAGHQFVSEKADIDEMAVVVFDNEVDLIDNSYLSQFSMVDTNGNSASYDYSEGGFVTDKAKLHFAMDVYNEYSGFWMDANSWDGAHSDRTDSISMLGNVYQWHGGTNLEEAVNTSLAKIKDRSNVLKRLFVMTDGQAYVDVDTVVATAKADNIVIHSLAISDDAFGEEMEQVALQTGGSYNKVIDLEGLTGIYSALQTTVKYAYMATLDTSLQSGDSIKIELKINDDTIDRIITIN